MKYKTQLESPKWERKRQVILKRDNYTCTECGSKDKLHVHHLYYISDHMAWNYPNNALITLCSKCHKKWHEKYDVEIRDRVWNKHRSYQPIKKGKKNKILANKEVSNYTTKKQGFKEEHIIKYTEMREEKLKLINESSLSDKQKEKLIHKENSFSIPKLKKMIKFLEV